MKYLKLLLSTICFTVIALLMCLGCEYVSFTLDLSSLEGLLINIVGLIAYLFIVAVSANAVRFDNNKKGASN